MKPMTKRLSTDMGSRASLAALTCGIALTAALPAQAGIAIPNKPVDLGSSVPPNVMMILDDSGSMDDEDLYDDRVTITGGGLTGGTLSAVTHRAYTHNTLFYNPTVNYTPWVKADSSLLPNTPYTAVYTSRALASGTTTSLLSAVQTFYAPKPAATNLQDVTQYFRFQIGTDGRIVRSERDAANLTVTNLFTRSGLSAARNTWVNGTTGATAPSNVAAGLSAAIVVPINTTELKVTIGGADSNANLYLRLNALPTTTSYNCRPNAGSSNETCTITNPAAGTWYVGVRAGNAANSDAFSNVTISAQYTTGDPETGVVSVGCDTSMTGWGWRHCTYATPTGRSEAAERQNFATWYSFYRSRMKAAKAGVTRAFSELGGDYRVGFAGLSTIQMRVPVASDGGLFRDMASPASSNRTNWFQKVMDRTAGGYTPLRGALRRVGTYYGESGAGNPYQGTGSVELACRQNFAILTTDGYWNNNSESGTGAPAHTDVSGDEDSGTTITGPNGATYTYSPGPPYLGNTEGTLADVAMHFWKQDLRTDLSNIVPTSGVNPAFWQHMGTFGISLGLRGDLDASDWPGLRSGSVQWPVPFDGGEGENIDDLWHAAVNGRGSFVAATSPQAFAAALRAALAAVVERTASSSNVSANSATFTTETKLFQARYVSNRWIGEVVAYPVTAAGVSATPSWSASANIPDAGSRTILTWNGSGGASFPTPAQSAALNTPTAGVTDYLRGDQTLETSQGNGGNFRDRVHLLGDIINSSPFYVQEGPNATDDQTLYIGANDGMLHAIDAKDGSELFGYVPGNIDLTALESLASDTYAHAYFVDGPVTVLAKNPLGVPAKSYLVGSLGRGGKGVFGLDVTNPSSFDVSSVLWDFDPVNHDLMGHVIGRPFTAMLNNGKFGVIVPNGPNSTNDTAVLYVLDVATGEVFAEINTGVGSAAAPNGLSSPRGWDKDGDGDLDTVYAGDLRGNFWKFDISSTNPSNWESALSRKVLFQAKDPSNGFQPISGSPTVAIDPVTFQTWVFFGTGRLLNQEDVTNPDSTPNLKVQTWYGLKDEDITIASRTALQQRKIVALGSIAGKPVRGFEEADGLDETKKGWYIDLVTPSGATSTPEGERIIGDSAVVGTMLLSASVIPNANECGSGGRGYINAVQAFTGASDHNSNFFDVDNDGDFNDDTVGGVFVGSIDLGVAMPTSPTIIENLLIAGGSAGGNASVKVNNPAKQGRISWREIIEE